MCIRDSGCPHLTGRGDNLTAAHLYDPFYGRGHILIRGTHHNDVVRVVGDARGYGAPPEAEPPDETQADVTGPFMALDNRDLQDILLDIRNRLAFVGGNIGQERLCDYLVRDQADDPCLTGRSRDPEPVPAESGDVE